MTDDIKIDHKKRVVTFNFDFINDKPDWMTDKEWEKDKQKRRLAHKRIEAKRQKKEGVKR